MILQGVERAQSLAIAIVRIAREKRSALLNQADLRDLVKLHCPVEHKEFWAGPYTSASAIAGLLQFEGFERFKESGPRYPWDPAGDAFEKGPLRKLIEAEGVLFWDREPDRCWRIVDSAWLSSHRDIWDWLRKQWQGGYTCRFCSMHENESLEELKRPEGRMHGLVHERCMPYFLAWHEIAAKYSSEDEARAADVAAGRASRYEKVVSPPKQLEALANG
jgi:hypothetical protein